MSGKEQVSGLEQYPSSHSRLKGRTIVVTRPRAQSSELAGLLESEGANVICLPVIQVVEPTSWDGLDTAIENISTYQWILFTSCNGVRFFFRRLSYRRSNPLSALEHCALFAIGAATARATEQIGAPARLVAEDSTAEGAVAALVDRLGGKERVQGLRFLLPRARIAREVLPDRLREMGAKVDVVEAYQTVRPDLEVRDIIGLLQQGTVDAIAFTSSSTVNNFVALIGDDGMAVVRSQLVVACIGPVTAETATLHGFTNIIQPAVYSAPDLAEAIALALSQPTAGGSS